MSGEPVPRELRPPSYALALVAVLLGGVASSYLAILLVGITPFLGVWGWYVAASLVGAWPVLLFLRALGYRISYAAAVVALLTGAVIATFVARWIQQGAPMLFMPWPGGITGLPSLLISAWMVQLFADKAARGRPRDLIDPQT